MLTYIKKIRLAALLCFACYLGNAQEFNAFDVRYQNNIKGDLTLIGNNIVNRDGGTTTTGPNDPYNNLSTDSGGNLETGGAFNYNDYKNMQYIDVDGDPSTFSSSSASLNFSDAECVLVRYAGLYWSATYPSATSNASYNGWLNIPNTIPIGDGRQSDFNQVKFRMPGSSYVDITADEILYDGFTSTDSSMRTNSPYACYADVTDLVSGLADPSGEYTLANIRAVTGSLIPGGGASGGWTLVIVYENPNLTGKLITTFDGFARVNSSNNQIDIEYNGFNTIPIGPVNADVGAASLEGDFRISGDGMAIRSSSNTFFTPIENSVNPDNNFFNSNITLDGVLYNNRVPASANTLGYDSDIFLLGNPANSVIPNEETDATLRFTSSGDQYYPFFNSFSVEIIEPLIVLEKRVEDIAGNDITGAGVTLGQYLEYVLTFDNIGNDDATEFTIRDVLPINTQLDEDNVTVPPGVTFVYNAALGEITFTIPDYLVEVDQPEAEIRLPVRVAENCFDFVDACTNSIDNQAYSTYRGVINNNQITDDPSVSEFDNCGFVTPGATNFLLDDLSSCDFTRTVQLCGDGVLLDAGDNFDGYTWYLDTNENGIIDAGDTPVVDADTDNDPSTFLATYTGTYIVDKEATDPCLGFQEIIHVTLFGTTQNNPISALINDTGNTVDGTVLICPNDGEELPEIFLCGENDTELIQINIPDADSINWEQLDEASCAGATQNCANKNNSCTWNLVATGNDFVAEDAGQYRMVINYQNGCFTRFYFNIFKNLLNPQYESTDIICDDPGNILVTNVPNDYEFQLVNADDGSVVVPYNTNPSFTIVQSGIYEVEMRQQGVTDGCVFRLEDIGIRDRDFQVQVEPRDTDCNGLGELVISVLNVEPQYSYEILQGGVSVDTFGPTMDNGHTFANLNAGTYQVRVTTDSGCAYDETHTINDASDLALSALNTKEIDCTDGTIELTATGGDPIPNYFYAIWSYNGTNLYNDVSEIPGSAYEILNVFSFTATDAGVYEFIVVDGNNCSAISNAVSIAVQPAVEYTTLLENESCFGFEDGSYSVNVTQSNGFSLSYQLTHPDGSLETNTSGLFTDLSQGGYFLVITQEQGGVSCEFTESFSIGGPTQTITADAVLIQDYTCSQTATIEAQNIDGGTPSYEFSIDGVNFVSGFGAETFTGLANGTYSITLRDQNGCTFETNEVVIPALTPPTDLTFASAAPNCPTNTADITVTAVGGVGPFTFELVSPTTAMATSVANNVGTFAGLVPDTYTFRVTDDRNCSYEENFTLNPITPISLSVQIGHVSCFGGSDGQITATVDNFTGTYDYEITGPVSYLETGQMGTSFSYNTLPEGNYSITVTDNSTNCSQTEMVTINQPSAALGLLVNETQPSCLTNGSVVLTGTNGWGAYEYSITNPDGTPFGSNTTGVFDNLVQQGNYTATVTDVNNCSASSAFTINASVAPELEITANNLCYDTATGLSLTATVLTGGQAPFEYRINGRGFGPNAIFTNLGPGTHTITVRDANNCTDTESITIAPELTLSASALPISACGGNTEIQITAAGGDGNYQYALVLDGVIPTPADFSTTNPITATSVGDYDVYVRDHNGGTGFCEASVDIAIAQDAALVLTESLAHVSCFGGNNGSISLTASNGEAPYWYSIDNGASYVTQNTFNSLSAGNYSVAIRDANGCEVFATATINEPNQIMAEALLTQDLTCLQDAVITVGSVTPTSGGSGSYQYSLNGASWTASTTGGTSWSGLLDGTYTVYVRDAAEISCSIALAPITINPLPTEPTISSSISYSCDGSGTITILPLDPSYTYSLDGGAFQTSNTFGNVAAGIHTIAIDYGSNCTVQTDIPVDSGLAFDAAINSHQNPACSSGSDGTIAFQVINFNTTTGFEYAVNGGAFSAPQTSSPITVTGLTAGTNTIVVRDVVDTACSITLTETLTAPSAVVATALITDMLTCTNGGATISASASGGLPGYEFELRDASNTPISGYDFATNGSNTIFSGLADGTYRVAARDTNNCIDVIDADLIVAPITAIVFTATPTVCYSGYNDATIQVAVSDGNGGYQFSLNSGPFITPSPSTSTTHTFTNLQAGTYTIDVRDQYGCTAAQQTVTINPELTATAFLNSDLTCLVDATVTLSASGGSGGPYSYEWSNDGGGTYATSGFLGNTFTTNTVGTYQFRITDSSTPTVCTVVTGPVTITPAEQPVIANVVPTAILCHGGLTGSLDVTIDTAFGLAPYTINVQETSGPTNYGTQTTGLPAGDYQITVTDAKGCVSNAYSVTIAQPDPIAYSINLVPITCNLSGGGTDPGSITVENVVGGTAEYTYYLTGNNGYSDDYTTTAGGEDHTFDILEFGIYEVDVVDAYGCSVVTTNIIASPPNDLDIDVSTVTPSCVTGGTAIVTVSSAVGSGNYQFAILETYASPYSTTYFPPDVAMGDTRTFNGLVPGITYTFVVYDITTNCYYFEEAASPINSPSAMTTTLDVVANSTCTGAADGNIDFTFDNYDATATSVTYEIFNLQSNTSTGIAGTETVSATTGAVSVTGVGPLPQGVYYLLLHEVGGVNDGCSVSSVDFTITESSNLLQVTASSPTNDNCGVNAGVINAVAQYGTAPYEFQYLDALAAPPTASSTGWVSDTSANVEAGVYTVYVKDAYGCIAQQGVTVLEDISPSITLSVVDQCAREGDKEVLLFLANAASASGPFQLSVNGSALQPISFDSSFLYTVTGLSSGSGQTFTLVDVNGCAVTETFDIIPHVQVDVSLTAPLGCGVGDNAEITIEFDNTNGTGLFFYTIVGPAGITDGPAWLPGNIHVFTGASLPGTYTIQAGDINGTLNNCDLLFTIEVPPAPDPPINVIAYDNVSCNGAADGSITVSTTDLGNGPYTFELVAASDGSVTTPIAPSTSGATTATFTGLNADSSGTDYTIEVTAAANSCTANVVQRLYQPPAITIDPLSLSQYACTTANNPNTAMVTFASASGGSGTFVRYQFFRDGTLVQDGTNPTFTETDFLGGNYTLTVYDDQGCSGTTAVGQSIAALDALVAASASSTNPLSCNGADGEITVSVTTSTNDMTRLAYSIDGGTTWQDSGSHTNPEVFGGLAAGAHTIIVRHLDTGCELTTTTTFTEPNTFTIDVNVLNNVVCEGTVTGGASFELLDASYTGGMDWEVFDTNGTPSDTSDDLSVSIGSFASTGPTAAVPLAAGDYYVSVTQTAFPQCNNTQAFTIAGPSQAITGNVAITDITCAGNDGFIHIIEVNGGWGGYQYYVGTGVPTAADYVASAEFGPLTAGTYQAWVVDAQGCPELIQDNITLAYPTTITGTLQLNNANCTNIEGEIEVVVVNGGQNGNYTYQLILNGTAVGSPQPSSVFGGLGAGVYHVEVTDQWGCSATVGPQTLYDGMNPVAVVAKDIDCSANPDGEITINVTGGSGNFSYAATYPISGTVVAQPSNTFTGLNEVGTYTFTVTDLDTSSPSCTNTVSTVLSNPSSVLLDTPSIVNVSCFGGTDGSVTANLQPVSTGVNEDVPFTYVLYVQGGTSSLAGPQNSPVFTGLTAGFYEIVAISDKSCESARQTIEIEEPPQIMVSASASAFACTVDNNTATATITINASGGTAPYYYSIDGSTFRLENTIDVPDTGSAQNITVYVEDINGCTTTTNVPLDPINSFTASVSQTVAISCANPEEVLVTVTDNGDLANTYLFELLPLGNTLGSLVSTPTNTSAIFNLTEVGSYVFRITDTATGCYATTAPYDIAPYDLMTVDATAIITPICFGDTNGSLQIDITGYTDNYDYEVFDSFGVTTGIVGSGTTSTNPMTIAGLSGGAFYVEITQTDNPLCSMASNTITIQSPDLPLDIVPVEAASVGCSNDRGEMELSPTGGYPPYSLVLTNTTTGDVYQANDVIRHVFVGLSAGDYTVLVTDINACTVANTVTLVQPDPISANIAAAPTQLLCFGDTNAQVQAIGISGGEGVYQYRLNLYDETGSVLVESSGYQSQPVFDNLGAGTYSITVSDGWNCAMETPLAIIQEPTEIIASLVQLSRLSCTQDPELLLSATGGTSPYEFSSDGITYLRMDGGDTQTLSVVDGSYQYYVRDSQGCTSMLSNEITIDPLEDLELHIDESAAVINCTDDASAALFVTATGGLAEYQFELYTDAALQNLVAGPQDSGVFTDLVWGSYHVRVTSQDCDEVSEEITIVNPEPLQLINESYTNISCAGADDGTITVEVVGGTGTISYAISPFLDRFDTQNYFTNLSAGFYEVLAQDENGCFMAFQFAITEPSPLEVSTVYVDSETCFGSADGSFELLVEGGTAPYSTSLNSNLDGDFVQDQLIYEDLAATNYVVFVRDSQGCEVNIAIEIEPSVNLNAALAPIYLCTGNISENTIEVVFEDDSVTTDVMYALNSTDPDDLQFELDFENIPPGENYLTVAHTSGCVNVMDFVIADYQPLTLSLGSVNLNEITAIAAGGTGEYTFYFNDQNNGADNTYTINETGTYMVRVVDQNGCESWAELFIEFVDVAMPDFFTPGDGNMLNETWKPENLEPYPSALTIIYDRYGRELYKMHIDDDGWDGTYDGNNLPSGDYWYVLKLDPENDNREFIGHFTLYR